MRALVDMNHMDARSETLGERQGKLERAERVSPEKSSGTTIVRRRSGSSKNDAVGWTDSCPDLLGHHQRRFGARVH